MTLEYIEDKEGSKEGLALSVIVPIYNGEHYIIDCISHLHNILTNITRDYEIIVVDDGSIDDTKELVEGLTKSDSRIRLVSYSPNMGKGYAVKQGVLSAKGNIIIFIDGDNNINPSIISSYIKSLEDADIVIGSKYHKDSKVEVPLSRRIASRCFQLLVRILLNIKVSDTQVGLKAGRYNAFKEIFKRVVVKRYAFDAEMLAIATLLNYKIVEYPVNIKIDKHFKFKEIVRMFIDVLAIAYRLKIRKSYSNY